MSDMCAHGQRWVRRQLLPGPARLREPQDGWLSCAETKQDFVCRPAMAAGGRALPNPPGSQHAQRSANGTPTLALQPLLAPLASTSRHHERAGEASNTAGRALRPGGQWGRDSHLVFGAGGDVAQRRVQPSCSAYGRAACSEVRGWVYNQWRGCSCFPSLLADSTPTRLPCREALPRAAEQLPSAQA